MCHGAEHKNEIDLDVKGAWRSQGLVVSSLIVYRARGEMLKVQGLGIHVDIFHISEVDLSL